MAKYNIYDIQCERYVTKKVSKEWVIAYAFHIVEDRALAVDDDLARKFQKYVNKGLKNFSYETAKGILDDWEYRVEKVKNKKKL